MKNEIDSGATAVITHSVKDGFQSGYENWLNEIEPVVKAQKGILDVQVVRPISGMTSTYTIILRFNTHENLLNWLHSQDRKRLIEKAQPLLTTNDKFHISSGLDFWFTPEGAKAKLPIRWKQFLITWSAIYPSVLFVSILILPILHKIGIPTYLYTDVLLVSGLVTFLMVYVIMPRYTRLIQNWLFK